MLVSQSCSGTCIPLCTDPINVEDRDGILNTVVDSVVAEYEGAEKLSTVESYQMRRLLLPHMEHLFDLDVNNPFTCNVYFRSNFLLTA